MKLSGSILDLTPKTKEAIQKISASGLDYIHVDVMDGDFVPNVSFPFSEVSPIIVSNLKYDVHLMVQNPEIYIEQFSSIHPEFITFHYEIGNTMKWISEIRSKGIKAGLSVKPDTDLEEIKSFLPFVDLVLVMSVEPGKGGQAFLEQTYSRIEELYHYRNQNHLHYQIEVDGGINNQNTPKLKKCDMIVVGSFITKGNYKEQIDKIREAMK